MIIGWVNSDDAYYDTHVITTIAKYFIDHPQIDVVYGHAAIVASDGLVLQYYWVPPFSSRLLRLYDYISQPAAFIRRSALPDYLADEGFSYMMDWDLWLRLVRVAKFGRIDRLLAVDRHHPARKGIARPDLIRNDYRLLRDRHRLPDRNAGVSRIVGRPIVRSMNLVTRLCGTRIAARAAQDVLAFDGYRDRWHAMLTRQLTKSRTQLLNVGSART
jgi:hypothetical protein